MSGIACIDELDGVLEVRVVIAGAVQQQQIALQAGDVLEYRALIVALGVLLRRAQVSLGVDRIVETPVAAA